MLELEFEASSPRFRVIATALLCFATAFAWLSTQEWRAQAWAKGGNYAALARSAEIQPKDAEVWHLLGRASTLVLLNADEGVRQFDRAIALNPRNGQYWVDLAVAQQMRSDTSAEQRALDTAMMEEPHSPRIAWTAANLSLVNGQTATALRYLAEVVAHDPTHAQTALSLSWQATHDLPLILDSEMNDDPDTYVRLGLALVERRESELVPQVWHAAMSRHITIPPDWLALDLVRRLASTQGALADSMWTEFAGVDPRFVQYVPEKGDSVVNAGFESELLDSGLDWEVLNEFVSVQRDATLSSSGNASLRIEFSGNTGAVFGVQQHPAAKPLTQYNISFVIRTADLSSASGPRVEVADVDSHQVLYRSDELSSDREWKHISGSFRTSSTAQRLVVRLVRDVPVAPISGTLWLDDVHLTPTP